MNGGGEAIRLDFRRGYSLSSGCEWSGTGTFFFRFVFYVTASFRAARAGEARVHIRADKFASSSLHQARQLKAIRELCRQFFVAARRCGSPPRIDHFKQKARGPSAGMIP
jgi:hypothetical protein